MIDLGSKMILSLIVCHPFIVFWMSLAIMGEKKNINREKNYLPSVHKKSFSPKSAYLKFYVSISK